MRAVIVSHTHWDREWYRTFQQFRARLVDAVDRLLELSSRDPGYRFVLDGQSIVLEDYLELRPERREELARLVRERRIAIGPWYVQPDSLLPSGEAHVRNLLEGRRVGETLGPVSRIAYTPDSFGHPAQLPQLLRGFGFEAFVYWRGNGNEWDALRSEYQWQAPDGTRILACHLARGYFAAAFLGSDAKRAAARLERLGRDLAERASGPRILVMNGVDHQQPEADVAGAADALAERTGWEVVRGDLESFVGGMEVPDPVHRGELCGGRVANLLPGVWSSRIPLKLRNRACEAALLGWAEPFSALGRLAGLPDESPALRQAWRALLANQAHDSICGCSRDLVHEQMEARYDAALELAHATSERMLERLAGLDAARETPWTDAPEICVFNPSPYTRTGRVRLRIDPEPALRLERTGGSPLHPLLRATLRSVAEIGFEIDGEPVRVFESREEGRYRLLPQFPALDLEWVARDVPAFGLRRVRLAVGPPAPDRVDDGREIAVEGSKVRVDADGSLEVELAGRRYRGLCGLEDVGDRGDTYDFDPVPGDVGVGTLEAIHVERLRHPSGISRLRVSGRLRVPRALAEDRARRSHEQVALPVEIEALLAPGVPGVALRVTIDNQALDHRLRLRFATGDPIDRFHAATTFDVAERRPGPPPASDWVHAAPATFPHLGWVCANGLSVCAPGLPEAEVEPDGTIAITLLRATGWLSRGDLASRPQPAGPCIPTPGAQCPGPLSAELTLLPGADPRAARSAELGLRAVFGGPAPLWRDGDVQLELDPPELVLSALKPLAEGDGLLARVLNPTDQPHEAILRICAPGLDARASRLDEQPADFEIRRDSPGGPLRFDVPPHALRSIALETRSDALGG
ncbi:MAG: hypothetical protein ACE5IL_04695 [Myxococcota bacterium]